ncbi:MAG: hypothetical protein HY296_03460 [Thaumarchaeota archaeon]|nr:hypothetical protein [Nitrososphaerota archaeon]
MKFGKADLSLMERVVYQNLGKRSAEVVAGPGAGLDNAVIRAGEGKVLVITTDPVSLVPQVGVSKSAWLSVHLIASDFTTSGLSPQFATFAYNFPPETEGAVEEEYLKAVGRVCKSLGCAIVAGHTGRYPGAGLTVVGAGTMFGFGADDEYVTSSMAKPGDSILMTKTAGIEASAYLAASFPGRLAAMVGSAAAKRAMKMIDQCSTVEDAIAASRLGLGRGGVTAMHDATEGGVLGGLAEMASASRCAFSVDPALIPVSDDAREVCRAFGIDPLTTLSEGALLLTCSEKHTRRVVEGMKRSGREARRIGEVKKGEGLVMAKTGRKLGTLPRDDPYWGAYVEGVREGFR